MHPPAARFRMIFIFAALGFVFGAVELISAIGLCALAEFKDIRYRPVELKLSPAHRQKIRKLLDEQNRKLDPYLGWGVRRSVHKPTLRINAQGIRSDREYPAHPEAGMTRIAAFGDSFTYGGEVDEETWVYRLDASGDHLEVLNFGCSGYGLDQTFLRYKRDGVIFEPRIVLIGYMSENIFRNVNAFRPFYTNDTGIPLAKPRFVTDGARLKLLGNPLARPEDYERLLEREADVLARIGRTDFFFQTAIRPHPADFLRSVRLFKIATHQLFELPPDKRIIRNGVYNPKSEAFKITAGIFDLFHDEVRGHGSIPVILIFPEKEDFEIYRRKGMTRYSPLLETLRSRGFRIVDLMQSFAAADPKLPVEKIFQGAHYSAHGQAIVARAVEHYLKAEGLVP